MREIKFRVWEENIKQMFYNVGIVNDELYLMLDCVGFDVVGDYREFKLMQYTGLKDFGGTEIYEGDIIEEVVSNKPKRFEVVWDESAGMFLFAPLFKTKPMGAIDFYELEDEYGKVIVIGNKFENPELLEGTE